MEVPIGTYHVAWLTLRVRGAEGVFSFTFDCENSRANPITVTADSSVEMDLLGKLRVVANSATIRQGESASLLITPMVRTKSGLYLTNSSYGKLDASTENRMTSVSLFGERQFHLGSSGFS